MSERNPDYDELLVVNPLPWERKVSGAVSKYVVEARGAPDDHLSARHWQDREINDEAFVLPPVEVPGFGYRVVSQEVLLPDEEWPYSGTAVVETDRYRLTFDREHGGIVSWYDRNLDCEWIDDDEYSLGGFVIEQLVERDHDRPRDLLFRAPELGPDNPGGLWNAAPEIVESKMDDSVSESPPNGVSIPTQEWGYQMDWNGIRRGPEAVIRHRVYRTPQGYEVVQHLDVTGIPTPVELRFRIPKHGPGLTVDAQWEMPRDTHPTSTYLTFPFDLPDPTPRVDVGDQAMEPGTDQLQASCHDYYTAQRWVDLAGEDRGVTVACPINPMVQFGDFSFGDAATEIDIDRALLLGWVTTNFYNTNFRAHQPGTVRSRYHLNPYRGEFDEARAHRVGRNAEHERPLVQPLAESTTDAGTLRTDGQFLDLPSPPVLVPQLRPAGDAGSIFPPTGVDESTDSGDGRHQIDLSVLNASDEPQTATIDSALLPIIDVEVADLFGDGTTTAEPTLDDGTVSVVLAPRQLLTLHLDCRR